MLSVFKDVLCVGLVILVVKDVLGGFWLVKDVLGGLEDIFKVVEEDNSVCDTNVDLGVDEGGWLPGKVADGVDMIEAVVLELSKCGTKLDLVTLVVGIFVEDLGGPDELKGGVIDDGLIDDSNVVVDCNIFFLNFYRLK